MLRRFPTTRCLVRRRGYTGWFTRLVSLTSFSFFCKCNDVPRKYRCNISLCISSTVFFYEKKKKKEEEMLTLVGKYLNLNFVNFMHKRQGQTNRSTACIENSIVFSRYLVFAWCLKEIYNTDTWHITCTIYYWCIIYNNTIIFITIIYIFIIYIAYYTIYY